MVVHLLVQSQPMAAQDVDLLFTLLNKWSAKAEFGTNGASIAQIVGNHWIPQISMMVLMEISTAEIVIAEITDQKVSVMV